MKKVLSITITLLIASGLTACSNTKMQVESSKEILLQETSLNSQDAEAENRVENADANQEVGSEERTEDWSASEEEKEDLGTGQYLKDIDWESFRTRVSEEDYQALQKYLPVLTGEEFIWIYRSGEGEEPDTYVHDKVQISIREMVRKELEENGLKEEEAVVDSILFADVFQSGSENVCLLLRHLGWYWLILHEEDGVIYGIDMPVRWFEGVQKDGLYYGSGGAGYTYYHRMKFEDGDYIVEDIAEVIYGELFIGGEKRSDAEYQAWKNENVKEEAKWYAPLE